MTVKPQPGLEFLRRLYSFDALALIRPRLLAALSLYLKPRPRFFRRRPIPGNP